MGSPRGLRSNRADPNPVYGVESQGETARWGNPYFSSSPTSMNAHFSVPQTHPAHLPCTTFGYAVLFAWKTLVDILTQIVTSSRRPSLIAPQTLPSETLFSSLHGSKLLQKCAGIQCHNSSRCLQEGSLGSFQKTLMPGLHPRLIKSGPLRGGWGPGFILKAPQGILMFSQGWNQGCRRSLIYCTFTVCPHPAI